MQEVRFLTLLKRVALSYPGGLEAGRRDPDPEGIRGLLLFAGLA